MLILDNNEKLSHSKLKKYVYYSKVFSMPILIIRGHQIRINDAAGAAAVNLIVTISRPLARYAFFGSIFMTIVITFERYCGKILFYVSNQ